MASELETAAASAGLVDMDLLKIAKPGLSPKEAVADLGRRYPGAFKGASLGVVPPTARDIRGMSRADADAEIKRYLREAQRYQMELTERDATARVMERYATKDRSRRR